MVYGDFWPVSIWGRGKIMFAILRQVSLILCIWRFKRDVYFVDQLSVGILLLKVLCPQTKVFLMVTLLDFVLLSLLFTNCLMRSQSLLVVSALSFFLFLLGTNMHRHVA